MNDICAALGLAVDTNDNNSPCKLRKHILYYLEEEDVTSQEDEGMVLFLELNYKIDKVKLKNKESNESLLQQVMQDHQPVDENTITQYIIQ